MTPVPRELRPAEAPPKVLLGIREDARFFHALMYPGRKATWRSGARVVSSRGFLLLEAHRVMQSLAVWSDGGGALGPLRRAVAKVVTACLDQPVQVLTKSDVRVDSNFAPGVYLSDGGNVILGARAVGRGTVIHGPVTIGWSVLHQGTPTVGENVWIGPNTVIVGKIEIGDGATVMPGTVLTRSVPPGYVAQGNPATFVRRGFDNAPLRRSLSTDVEHLLDAAATG